MFCGFREAKNACNHEVMVWEMGIQRRKLFHVDEMAAAMVFLMNHFHGEDIINNRNGMFRAIWELEGFVKDAGGSQRKLYLKLLWLMIRSENCWIY